MDIRQITAKFSVSPQIEIADIRGLAELGFGCIISNRPDGEVPGQHAFEDISREAAKYGMVARYLPIYPGQLGQPEVDKFRSTLHELPGPVLAYCRSGTRSAMLWSVAEAQEGMPLAGILSATRKAGYDVSGLLSQMAS